MDRFRLDDPDAAEKAAKIWAKAGGYDWPSEPEVQKWQVVLDAIEQPRPPLFQRGDFTLHSGAKASWKIECDALTEADWDGLAVMLAERIPSFGSVEGVPRGGLPLEHALKPYVTSGPLLIVDDVVTTGASLEEHRAGREAIGAVVFARGAVPQWVTPLLSMTPIEQPHPPTRSQMSARLKERGVFGDASRGHWMDVFVAEGWATEDPEPEVARVSMSESGFLSLNFRPMKSSDGHLWIVAEWPGGRHAAFIEPMAALRVDKITPDPEPEVDPAHVEADEVTDTLRAVAQYLMGRGPAPDIDALAPELRDMVDELLPAIVELVGDRIVPAEPEVDPAQVEALAKMVAQSLGGFAERVNAQQIALDLLASGRVQVTP